ncbi:MAG: hypothetical protein ACLTE2_10155 [Eubacteriales bacterium]
MKHETKKYKAIVIVVAIAMVFLAYDSCGCIGGRRAGVSQNYKILYSELIDAINNQRRIKHGNLRAGNL